MPLVYIAVLLSLFDPTPVAAQPSGYQEYYVLGYEEHVWRAFVDIYDGPDHHIPSQICSTVSVVATTNHQVIYYDHWEDGYEPDLLDPVQSTTEVHGDGDPSNGGTGSDLLLAGDEVHLTSDESNDTINGYVPVNRRDPDQIRYDGGDRVTSRGGPVNLTHAMWPINRSWVGGAWEVYSQQAYADSYSYRLPVGEDLYDFGGGDTGSYGDFRNVYLQLGAFEDNTTVLIDNGTDIVNLTLDRGQTYSSMGYINSAAARAITVNAGTIIRANKPTQVGLITGADSIAGYQGRSLIVLPDRLWGADYVVPVPSGDPGEEAEVYLSNPNDFPITVHAYDREIQATFVISPTSHISATVPYSQKRGGYVPADSAVRFTSSDGAFGVVVCADSSHINYAWGYSAIPSKYLTRDYYVPWAPGSYNTPPAENGSPVWVTPLTSGTTFYVDFSPLDSVVDETFTLDTLQQRRIFDPDNDNTGMHVWATSEFSIVWGEDPRTANYSSPYLDMGLTTLPLLQRWLDPVLTLDKMAEPTILPPAGGAVTFTLVAQAHDVPLVNVDITDILPNRWTYVPGSTEAIFPDGSTGSPEPRIDEQTLFWDLSANVGLNRSVTLTFQAQITDTAGVTVSTNRGEAVGKHQHTDAVFNPSDEANVYISPLTLVKSVSSAQARAGDTLVYTLSYANPRDSNTVTNAVLRDVVPIQHVTFQSASDGGTYNPASGTVNWALGTLAPGASGSVTFTVRVNNFVRNGTVIKNVGYINSAQTAEAGSNVVRTTVLAPEVRFTKSGPTAAVQGQVITYTLSYENAGGAQATGVTIQDTIPVSTTYETGSLAINTGSGWVTLTDADDGDQGAYIPPTLTIAPGATAGSIAVGETGQIRFSVRLDDDLSRGSLVQNWATLDRDLGIPRESNLAVTRISDLATIHGTVFEDIDGDGVRDAGEPGIHQVLITLDGIITTTTDLDGSYTFSITVPGVHTVVETDPIYSPAMFDESSVETGDMPPALESGPIIAGKLDLPGYFSTTPNEVHVDVTLGQSHRVDFGDMLTDSGFASIHGTVFNDADGDGVRDAGESGIPGVRVTLDGAIATTTDINGCYTFSTTVAGTHTVVETDRAGYFSTTPNEVHVDVTLGHGYRVEFGDALITSDFATIYGTVFEDLDRDGTWDADELGIPDVLIALDWIITTTTDLNGSYTFSTTTAGTHTVLETDPDNHMSTTPNMAHVDVSLGEGYQVDFGDMRLNNAACDADIYEEDDTALQAATFLVGTSQAHQFCDDATDWVKFAAWVDNVYTITTSSWGQRADTYLALFDRDGQRLLAANDDSEGTADYSSRIVWQAPVDGAYYVRTTNRGELSGYRTDYDLLIEGLKPSTIYLPIVTRNQDSASGTDRPGASASLKDVISSTVLYPTGVISHTCPDAYEPDDTWEQTTNAIEAGVVQIHSFDSDPQRYAADKDFVRFDVSTGTAVIFRTAPVTNTQTLMELYDERGASLFVTATTRLIWIPDTSGSYYLSVSPQGGITSFGCADTVGYNLLMETPEANFTYLPVVTRNP